MYAYANIRPLDNGKIQLVHINEDITEEIDSTVVLSFLEKILFTSKGNL